MSLVKEVILREIKKKMRAATKNQIKPLYSFLLCMLLRTAFWTTEPKPER